jgi:hypothetical protein
MNGHDKMIKRFLKNRELFVLAIEYENKSMWSYIEDFKDEYKKPNQVDKMRHRAIKKQCFKRAKKELSK